MYAIITTEHNGSSAVYYGPFTTREAANRYAYKHDLTGLYIVVMLHDSGDAMDTQ